MRQSRTTTFSLNRMFVVLLAALVIVAGGIFGTYRVQANRALREAKNVALSMRLLRIYGEANGETMLDPSAQSGLTARAELDLMELSDASGEIRLIRWDTAEQQPAEFTYTYKQCIVTYCLNENGENDWKVEYKIPIMHYDP